MFNKQNLWFITLFSHKVKSEEKVVAEVKEETSSLTALRVSKENSRKEKIESLENSLTSDNLSSEEKNNTYELLKYYNELQGKEENYEKKLKKEFDLDCFTKIDNSDVEIICISEKHDKELANKIMRTIQNEYQNKMNITVKFQKK